MCAYDPCLSWRGNDRYRRKEHHAAQLSSTGYHAVGLSSTGYHAAKHPGTGNRRITITCIDTRCAALLASSAPDCNRSSPRLSAPLLRKSAIYKDNRGRQIRENQRGDCASRAACGISNLKLLFGGVEGRPSRAGLAPQGLRPPSDWHSDIVPRTLPSNTPR